jgi:hypothetical protein
MKTGWVNKDQWTYAFVGATQAGRRVGKRQNGVNGNGYKPTTYEGIHGVFPLTTPTLPNGARQPRTDVLDLSFVSQAKSASAFPAARNKAWAKFVENVRTDPASLGVALAEWEQSFGMITLRATQLFKGVRALRKGDFRGFLRTFGTGAKRKHRNKLRNGVNEVSSLWLEYSFGWKPAVQDIWDGMNAIGQPIPEGRCSGSGSQDFTWNFHPSNAAGERFATRGKVKMGAKVFVSNPNLYLAQQLGIANPYQIAWELVPFSFVADWVFDVSTWLGAFTDLLGCEVSEAYTTRFAAGTVTTMWYWDQPTLKKDFSLVGRVAVVERRGGLDYPFPNFNVRANIGQSWNRAANAVSLLGQILTA